MIFHLLLHLFRVVIPTPICGDTLQIIADLVDKARSSSVLWLLICLDTGSIRSAVYKTFRYKQDSVAELFAYGIPALLRYIDVALVRSTERGALGVI